MRLWPLLLGALVVALLAAVAVQPAWRPGAGREPAWIGGAWRQGMLLLALTLAGAALVANTLRPGAAWRGAVRRAGGVRNLPAIGAVAVGAVVVYGAGVLSGAIVRHGLRLAGLQLALAPDMLPGALLLALALLVLLVDRSGDRALRVAGAVGRRARAAPSAGCGRPGRRCSPASGRPCWPRDVPRGDGRLGAPGHR